MAEKLGKYPRRRRNAALALAASLLLTGGLAADMPRRSTEDQYDVVVVGAGPGGIAASVQAARMGARVALLEETDWIGGQMTAAGVGTMDEGDKKARTHGIYKEFASRAEAYYKAHHKSVNTCYYGGDSLCVDPVLGQTILQHMLDEQSKHLSVLTDTHVSQVLKQGNTVTGVVANGKRLRSQVVIDASEYGDTLAQAGADYRIGNGTCTEPKEKACIQSISYVGIMKQYPGGVPDDLRFTQAPPGYNAKIAKYFARFITKDGNDHAQNPNYPLSFQSYAAFRGLPDLSNPNDYDGYQRDGKLVTRTALIAGNDYPTEGVLSSKFLTDDQYRQKAICDSKLLTVQLAYYIQHDLGQSSWSFANDEGYDTAYNRGHACANLAGFRSFERQLPVMPYVRESKRLIGVETLTGNNLSYSWQDRRHIPRYPNSIAVGYYPMDLHNCKADPNLESQFDRASDWSVRFAGGPFEVPLGVLIPQTVNGLLAAEKNGSASRLAAGATREQPIAMDIGQAAGALAALSVSEHVALRSIPYQRVQSALMTGGEPYRVGQ